MSVSGSWIHYHTLYSSSAVCHPVFVAVCVFYISPLPPPSFLPHLLLLCVCLWLWQLSSTPERDRLIIDCLFLPGLSTSSAPDYCIQYGDLMVLLLSVFFFCVFFAFVPMPFLFIAFHRGLQCHSTLLCLCSPESLHAGSLRPSFPACLPTWHPPSSTSLYNKSSLHYLLSPLSAFGSKNTISTMTVFTLFLLKKINK